MATWSFPQKKFFFILLIGLYSISILSSEKFKFKFQEGDSYRIHSTVFEDVFINNRFSHQAEIINRITVDVSDIQEKTDTTPASALYTCTFMTSEKNSSQTFSWGREYPSIFRRDSYGIYTISPEYFMPVVRDVPVFPDHDVKIGEKWTHKAYEAHDLRDGFNIPMPLNVPFIVNYTYKGTIEKKGKMYHLIEAYYTLNYTIPIKKLLKKQNQNRLDQLYTHPYPIRTTGYSKQQLFWDNDAGILPLYNESFNIQIQLNTGDILKYKGTAQATLTEIARMDKTTVADTIDKQLRDSGVENARVTKTDKGITISIENIQFLSDSARLLQSEKDKLKKIGTLLKAYPENELLITGHTARAGTVEARQRLSEERAAAVANYLIELGIKETNHIYTQGFGSEKPIAPNDTEKNKARNRRVEITILEK